MKKAFSDIKNKIFSVASSRYFPFVFYTFLMLVLHLTIRIDYGDDLWFQNILGNGNFTLETWWDFLCSRYNGWSSRLVIEGVLILIVHFEIIWKVLNIAVMVWIAVALSLFFNVQQRKAVNWFIILALLSFPVSTLYSAGWIATTLNYSWPLAFGLLAMLPIRNMVYGKKNRLYVYALAAVALIYCVNQEQMCAVMFAVCGVFTVYLFIRDKKIPWFVLVETVISIISLLFILTCPGNDMRSVLEAEKYFPTFSELTLFNKLEMGYSYAMYEFLMKPNLVFSLFCTVLTAVVFTYNKKAMYRCIAVIPLLFSLVMGLFSPLFETLIPNLTDLRYRLTETGTGFSPTSVSSWIPVLFVTAVGACVLVSLWSVFENKLTALFAMFILLSGLATVWVIGFSPTIWASGNRTCTFMFIAIIAISVMLLKRLCDADKLVTPVKSFVSSYIGMHILFLADQFIIYF